MHAYQITVRKIAKYSHLSSMESKMSITLHGELSKSEMKFFDITFLEGSTTFNFGQSLLLFFAVHIINHWVLTVQHVCTICFFKCLRMWYKVLLLRVTWVDSVTNCLNSISNDTALFKARKRRRGFTSEIFAQVCITLLLVNNIYLSIRYALFLMTRKYTKVLQ